MKSNPRFIDDISLMVIRYNYNYLKNLGFNPTELDISTKPGDLYLSRLPIKYYNASILTVFRTCVISRYFNACNTIYNKTGCGIMA